MNHPFGHDRLQNRYRISGKLLLDTPLRLSSGRASDETDAPLMRLFDDKTPLIPGSSLRGALRSELERIIAAVDPGNGLRSCTLFSDNSDNDDCAVQFRNYQQKQKADLTDQQIAEYAQDHLCSVCRLFGAAFFASRLIIEDAAAKQPYPGRIRDGVGIDRDTGAARETVKFDYEVLEPQSATGAEIAFGFAMQVENLAAQDKELIGIALALLKQGLHVGGKRAAGLGRIKLADDYEICGFDSPAELWRRLQAGEDLYQKYRPWEDVPVC